MTDSSTNSPLSLGEPPAGLVARTSGRTGKWLVALGLLQLATLCVVAALAWQPASVRSTSGSQRPEELRGVALALEERGLAEQAAAAWQDYLDADPSAQDREKVYYRIGALLMEADDYGGAVSSLIRAEQLAGDDETLKLKTGPKIVECLRRLGRYGEVGRELSRQVAVGEEGRQSKVLATFAGESFTDADLDRVIERRIDRLLAMQSSAPSSEDRRRILKQYQSPEARRKMLQQTVQRELFARRARELKIDRQDDFQRELAAFEIDLLAQRFLAQQLAQIRPTEVDLESYYAAHKADYRTPESASVIVLPIANDVNAQELLDEIKSADDFRSKATRAYGDEPAPTTVIKGRPHPVLGDVSKLFNLKTDQWTTTPHASGDDQFLVLVESKTPARTPPLKEARPHVEADYRRAKRQELAGSLMTELMDRYDVHFAVGEAPKGGTDK